jgi:hypothetical protein
MLSDIKSLVLALDDPKGVSQVVYNEVTSKVRLFMGSDAVAVLTDDMDKEDGFYFFPMEGQAHRTWKRMVHAYKEEKGLDKNETNLE